MTVDLFPGLLVARLALTLVHFLWQGSLVAAGLMVLLWILPCRRAPVRYLACLAALAIMALCPVVTFRVLDASAPADGPTIDRIQIPRSEPPVPIVQPGANPGGLISGRLCPYLVGAWATGVVVLSLRLGFGWVGVCLLRRSAPPVAPQLGARAAEIAHRLGLRVCPAIRASARVNEAIALGLLRPAILIPASWLAQVPSDVLEAAIAHELAHVRRWDLWVNVFQRFVETALFYHPAVWWVSRRTGIERELCCDQMAVAATGRPVAYVRALESLARRRPVALEPVLGAAFGGNQMSLLNRVRHVLGLAPVAARGSWLVPAAIIISLSLAAALLAASSAATPSAAAANEPTSRKPVLSTAFTGNTFATAAHLRDELGVKTRFEGLPTTVDPSDIDEDVRRLLAFYRHNGFFQARVMAHQLESNQSGDSTTLTFQIDEGPRFKIRKVDFQGNSMVATENLSRCLRLGPDNYFHQATMSADVTRIQDEYGARGYVFVDVRPDVRFLEDGPGIGVVYRIVEGPCCYVRSIRLATQPDATPPDTSKIARLVSLKPGELLDLRELRASEVRLRASGLFKMEPRSGQIPRITFGPQSTNGPITLLITGQLNSESRR